jgi:multidrug efflux pump subunit AcrA (membrane-fusion protein)
MAALIVTREDPTRRAPKTQSKLVNIAAVELSTLVPSIQAFGRVTSSQPVQLVSEVSGRLMQGEVAFKPAQSFRRGDLLVKIDDRQIRLELNSKKAELLTALAQLLPELALEFPEESRKWADYFSACEFDRLLPELPEPANQKIKLYLARFNVYKLYFEVKDLEIQAEYYYFRAPFDGSVVSANARVGAIARQGTNLGEIINLEDLEVVLSVPVEEVPWIDFDSPVILSSGETAGRWKGLITRVGSDIDDRTQAVTVFVSLAGENKQGLRSGTFLTAELAGRSIDGAVEVPRAALYSDRYVYLLSGGALEQREVTVAFSRADRAIVSDGLHAGDSLVTDVLQGVAPGMPAEPRAARLEP